MPSNEFPFTPKKFTSLSSITQHRWIIKWLSQLYQELVTNRISLDALHHRLVRYNEISGWISHPFHYPPSEGNDHRALLEFVSNAIQSHRSKAGSIPKDHDLLPDIRVLEKDASDLPFSCSDRDVSDPSKSDRPDYHMALDGLRSLFNIGSIFRTCDAAGFKSIILGNAPVNDHPAVKKTSMGTCDWVPSTHTDDLADRLIQMKTTHHYPIIGVETVEDSLPHFTYPWPKRGVIVMGNEEYGISRHVLSVCDQFVHIPMAGKKNSINVGCAAAVLAFHIAATLSK